MTGGAGGDRKARIECPLPGQRCQKVGDPGVVRVVAFEARKDSAVVVANTNRKVIFDRVAAAKFAVCKPRKLLVDERAHQLIR